MGWEDEHEDGVRIGISIRIRMIRIRRLGNIMSINIK